MFQTAKCCDMYYAILLEGPFDDAPESRSHGAKRLNIGSAVHQLGRLPTSQKSRFHGAKRSNMISAIPQEDRFADVQESRFQCA